MGGGGEKKEVISDQGAVISGEEKKTEVISDQGKVISAEEKKGGGGEEAGIGE